MAFLGVGEGRGIVVNDTAATKLNRLRKQAVSCAAIPLCAPARRRGNVRCWGQRGGLWLTPRFLQCPPGLQPPLSVPGAGRAGWLHRDLAAASCPTFKGTQNQTAGCSHVLRAGTAALLVFTL